ncbi:Endochitinase B1 [Lachnellula subtilissima]|uniref:chitinase n=1 Tax=Lachnellula subtilissima TaxID=602034 RepID=A0A8H8RMQ9_9HELO|nr:Endochitinase B1 [Lachnellula subtilissima]
MHCPTILFVLVLCGFALSNQTCPFNNGGNSSTPSQPDPDLDAKRTIGFLGTGDQWADVEIPYDTNDKNGNETKLEGTIKQLYLLKQQNRHLKTLLSVGGYTFSHSWYLILHNETCRSTFASSAVTLMYNIGLDGPDYDYESINSTDQAAQFVDLLNKTRTQLNTYKNVTFPFLLNFDAPAGPSRYKLLDIKGMDPFLDFWTFMAFDYVGSWTIPLYAGHAQNLYCSNDNLSTPFDTNTSIEYYISQGIAASKINISNPLYGHAFQNTNGPRTLFYRTRNRDWNKTGSIWDYKHLPLTKNTTIYENEDLVLSWSYDNDTGTMISYDTPKIARRKVRYVMNEGLGGAAWWQLVGIRKGQIV